MQLASVFVVDSTDASAEHLRTQMKSSAAFFRRVCFISAAASPTALKHQLISLIRPRMGCLH